MSENHTKRALSLDDLVNHDENDKVKLQKMANDIQEKPAGIGNLVNRDSVTSISGIVEETNEDESDTDTDDAGEVNFDNGMMFDYDKQDRFSPEKKRAAMKKKDLKSSESEEALPPQQPVNNRATSISSIVDGGTDSVERSSTSSIDLLVEKSPSTQDDMIIETQGEHKEESREGSVPLKEESLPPVVPRAKIEEKENLPEPNEKKEEPSVKKEQASKETLVSNAAVDKIFEEKTSSISKKNSVKKDLEVLNEISSSSKPNKYKNTPIWAQKWKPTVKALQNIDTNDFKIDSSILDIIPDDDMTKSVQDWIYATIYSLDPEMRPFIELEMKFGVLLESKSPDRVSPPISSQAVYTDMDAHLTPNVDETVFKELNKYIHGLSELTENSGKFNVIESETKDSVYRVGTTTQRPRFLRMSSDVKTGRVGQFIEKRHISQLLIYSPKDSYDVKISLNLELPVPDNDPPEKYLHQTPVSSRTKERVSYIHNDSCTRIDITKVHNHNQGIKSKDTEITHEIELEINTPALLKAFENITTDSKEYATLIRTFLNNGTIVRRKLSSLSYSIFEGQKKVN
ncbi:polynucleotide 5'-phosphatase [Nakaseomyces bracarensis]|uniref:polynucleotide 5'-phosphatase n=1 Tax=Nakaseomyces bracarensis TaxID=273131 RepID=UPI003871B933